MWAYSLHSMDSGQTPFPTLFFLSQTHTHQHQINMHTIPSLEQEYEPRAKVPGMVGCMVMQEMMPGWPPLFRSVCTEKSILYRLVHAWINYTACCLKKRTHGQYTLQPKRGWASKYRIVGNFRGRKLSWISRICAVFWGRGTCRRGVARNMKFCNTRQAS